MNKVQIRDSRTSSWLNPGRIEVLDWSRERLEETKVAELGLIIIILQHQHDPVLCRPPKSNANGVVSLPSWLKPQEDGLGCGLGGLSQGQGHQE
jgi:hypothetical protein